MAYNFNAGIQESEADRSEANLAYTVDSITARATVFKKKKKYNSISTNDSTYVSVSDTNDSLLHTSLKV